jgi:cytidylate kinase
MRLASSLGWHFMDSGVFYRLLGYAALRERLPLDNAVLLAQRAADLNVVFEQRGQRCVVLLDGEPLSSELRTETAGAAASKVAALPPVREALLELQRSFRQPPGLVADGRDMGTVVFPEAPLKVFLDASAEERAQRRHRQLKEAGKNANLSSLLREIEARDERDRNRAVAPLRPAEDAVCIDTTALSVDAVYQRIANLVRDCFPALRPDFR